MMNIRWDMISLESVSHWIQKYVYHVCVLRFDLVMTSRQTTILMQTAAIGRKGCIIAMQLLIVFISGQNRRAKLQ